MILNWKMIDRDYRRTPAKPVLDLETTYTEIVFGKQTSPLTDAMTRRAAYWAVFAGACGHTYGHNSIWQMFTPQKHSLAGAKTPWREALNTPGATQMGYLRQLMEARPFITFVPDNSIISLEPSTAESKCLALRGERHVLVYTPTGRVLRVRLGTTGGQKVQAAWFSPRTGQSQSIGEFKNEGQRTFAPPAEEAAGNDWVLTLAPAAGQ